MGHPRQNIPRHQIWKSDDIYECRACGKMYTDLMVDAHIEMCDKMEEFLVHKEETQLELDFGVLDVQ